jgi:hypothetical protein
LSGQDGPNIETQVGFETDAFRVRVRLDFGAGWSDDIIVGEQWFAEIQTLNYGLMQAMAG